MKGMEALTEGTSILLLVLVPGVVMIGLGQSLREAAVMVEVIGKTVMKTIVMKEVTGGGIVTIGVSIAIILLYALFALVSSQ